MASRPFFCRLIRERSVSGDIRVPASDDERLWRRSRTLLLVVPYRGTLFVLFGIDVCGATFDRAIPGPESRKMTCPSPKGSIL